MNYSSRVPKYFGLCLLATLTIFLSIEYAVYDLFDSLKEDIPRLYGKYALRSLFFVVASAAIVTLLHLKAVERRGRDNVLAAIRLRPASRQMVVAVGFLIANCLAVILLIFRPELFSTLGREDVFLEPISALLFFAGSTVFLWSIRPVHRSVHSTSNSKLVVIGLVCLALIFFVIAMEEVSWFQRVLIYETPDAFAANKQGEFNIHNFATKIFENALYIGAFTCLIGLPFLRLMSVLPAKLGGLEVFFGGPFTLCSSALFTAYNYHYWNGFSAQIPFFLAIFILISLGALAGQSAYRRLCYTTVVVLLFTQVAFFVWGHTTPRLWDATEYKEFFIATGFFLYSLDVERNVLVRTVSSKAQMVHNEEVKGVECEEVAAGEMWSFVKKSRNDAQKEN